MFVAMFRVVVGIVRVATVIQGAAWRFEQIVHCAIVHAIRQDASRFLIRRQGDQCSTVKCVKCMNFDIFHFNHIAGFHHDAAFFRYAPANPQIHAGFRTDERYVVSAVLHHGGSNVHVNMIIVIVSSQYGVDLANRKWIKDKRCSTQVWLQFFHAGHALHLMALFHQRVTVTLFAGAAPEIDAHIGAAF